MSSRSLLELLHPEGRIARVLVLGDAPATTLVPPAAVHTDTGVDLVLIVPSPEEADQSGWLAATGRTAHDALAEDGIAYAVLPRRARTRGAAVLRDAGLVLTQTLIHLGPGPRYLVPVARGPWRYAFGSLIAARPLLRRFLVAARRVPLSEHWLVNLAPVSGVLASRDGSAPPAAWVSRLEGEPPQAARTLVAGSWRRDHGSAVLHCFTSTGDEPSGVVKVAAGPSAEGNLLARLGPAAHRAGARVPLPLANGTLGDATVIAETAVGGMPAAAVLSRAPGRLDQIVVTMAGWLERWSTETAVRRGGAQRLEQELMSAMDGLGRVLPGADGYRRRLAAACSAVEDHDIPLVARHNDLTMWNVLLDAKGSIGVIDWGEAEETGLPLTDFLYAAVDATAASRGYRSRLEAVQACFPEGGAGSAGPLRDRIAEAIGIGPDAVRLCFHACWLRHARNETTAGTGDRSFLEIAGWLARAHV